MNSIRNAKLEEFRIIENNPNFDILRIIKISIIRDHSNFFEKSGRPGNWLPAA